MRQAPIPDRLLDATDKAIINALQDGLPVIPRPFAETGQHMGLPEDEVITRIQRLLEMGAITRFGPFFDAEAMGGNFCLCAMAVPPECFVEVVTLVNAIPEVAHNYERQHRLNMWFVVGSDTPEGTQAVIREIEASTGHPVLQLPKLKEFFVGFRVDV